MTALVQELGVSGVLVLGFLSAIGTLTGVFLLNWLVCRLNTAPGDNRDCATRH